MNTPPTIMIRTDPLPLPCKPKPRVSAQTRRKLKQRMARKREMNVDEFKSVNVSDVLCALRDNASKYEIAKCIANYFAGMFGDMIRTRFVLYLAGIRNLTCRIG
eukprot:324321_1